MGDIAWQAGKAYREIIYETIDGIAKITINRPERRNAFTPLTVNELYDAFTVARDDPSIGVIILTGANHGGRHEDEAFCSGGDQKIRGNGGYVGEDSIPRLNVLDLQRLIRVVPKPVIAMVNGYAIGGGHVLHILCDLSLAADTAKFGQTGPKVGSFDAGYGAGYLAAIVGQKKAREIWYLCRQYTAAEALEVQHVEARDIVLAHVAAVAADLLVAAGAERLVLGTPVMVGAREDDDADARVVARDRERVVELVHGERRERVAALGPVDGDLGNAIAGFVDDLAVCLARLPRGIAHGRPFAARLDRPSTPVREECSVG